MRRSPVKKLVMMPGERYEVIIDFAGFAGKSLIVTNTAKTPYPAGKPPQGATLGRIMQFRVQKPAAPVVDASYNPALGTALRAPGNPGPTGQCSHGRPGRGRDRRQDPRAYPQRGDGHGEDRAPTR